MKREYKNKISHDENFPEFDPEVMTVEEWLKVKNVCYGNYDGSGYWVKDGMESCDEVFSTEPEDATHVVWYSK